jgi:hypothetical protein
MYTKIGCALFDTLSNTAEGAKYLSQNKILRLIADGLAQLDPVCVYPMELCRFVLYDTTVTHLHSDTTLDARAPRIRPDFFKGKDGDNTHVWIL